MRQMIIPIVLIIFLTSLKAFAEPPANVIEEAQQYDWQTCVDSKSSDCLNACANSENLDCQDNCMTMAKDKCKTEGIYPSF